MKRISVSLKFSFLVFLVCLTPPSAFAQVWLGIEIEPVPSNTAAVHHLPPDVGAQIATVVPHGPADAAGLQPGDIILQLDFHEIRGPASVLEVTRHLRPGQAESLSKL